jgi:hypothetical protein
MEGRPAARREEVPHSEQEPGKPQPGPSKGRPDGYGPRMRGAPGEGEHTWRTTTGMKKQMMSMKTGEKQPAKRRMKKQ